MENFLPFASKGRNLVKNLSLSVNNYYFSFILKVGTWKLKKNIYSMIPVDRSFEFKEKMPLSGTLQLFLQICIIVKTARYWKSYQMHVQKVVWAWSFSKELIAGSFDCFERSGTLSLKVINILFFRSHWESRKNIQKGA